MQDKLRAMFDEAKTWPWLGLTPTASDEDVMERLAGRAGALELANKTSKRRGEERDEARRELCRALALAGPRLVAISPHEHAVGRWGQHVADKLFPQDEVAP